MPSIRAAVILLLAFASSVTPATIKLSPKAETTCRSDNCLRALLHKEREASAYSFCTSLLATTLPATATAAIPTYLANCGSTSQVSRLSSACPCLLQSLTLTMTTSTSISTPTSSPSPSSSVVSECLCSSTESTSTLPGAESTCPPTTVTETAPGSTVTETETDTETHTAPGTTITTPGPTTTVTSPAPARTCAEPVDDPGFEAFRPALYPWTFSAGGGAVGWSTGQNRVGTPGSHFPAFSGGRPHSGNVAMCLHIDGNVGPGSFWRLWQSLNMCISSTRYRPRLWYATNSVIENSSITFRMVIYITSIGNPTAAPVVAYTSTRTVSEYTEVTWRGIEFDAWTSADLTAAVLHLDVTTTRPNYVIWLDDITLAA